MLHSVADVSEVVLDECQFCVCDVDVLNSIEHILHIVLDEGHVAFPIFGSHDVGRSVGGWSVVGSFEVIGTHAQSLHIFGHFRLDKDWNSLEACVTGKPLFFLLLGAPFAGVSTGQSKSIGSAFSAGSFAI